MEQQNAQAPVPSFPRQKGAVHTAGKPHDAVIFFPFPVSPDAVKDAFQASLAFLIGKIFRGKAAYGRRAMVAPTIGVKGGFGIRRIHYAAGTDAKGHMFFLFWAKGRSVRQAV